MLDRKYILENLEAVKENCRNRNMQVDVDRFAQLEALRREKQRLSEDLNREANAVSKSIGQAKTPEEREERKERGRAVREQAAALKAELDRIEAELDTVWRAIPTRRSATTTHATQRATTARRRFRPTTSRRWTMSSWPRSST